jgi:hypothetical protein
MIQNEWREVVDRKQDFLRILKLLVDFDEKTGLAHKYPAPEAHYIRHAIAVANPETTRIFLRRLKSFVYVVVAEHVSTAGMLVCTYVHEDGIRRERETAAQDHPVHKIVCLTDLFETSLEPANTDSLNSQTKLLMAEHRNG